MTEPAAKARAKAEQIVNEMVKQFTLNPVRHPESPERLAWIEKIAAALMEGD